jgi:Protein of unknown function (DUF2950)
MNTPKCSSNRLLTRACPESRFISPFVKNRSKSDEAEAKVAGKVRRAGVWGPALTRLMLGLVVGLPIWAPPMRLLAAGEQRFGSPQAAVDALKAAVEARNTNALHAIFGPEAHALVSADVVQAAEAREAFVSRLKEKVSLVPEGESKEVLQLGADGWPFPIPLVRQGDQWFFDTAAGKQEILDRRIGADELGAIHVCLAYVEAQREYASQDRNGDEVLEYAQQLRSTPGTHDGLYWSTRNGDELSPLGPLVAQAWFEGYRHKARILTEAQSPYHGYYFKILTRQGKHAPGGKYKYIINGHMIAGFALVAWPAQWDNTGVMTFIVNQQGKVYQKNLGPKTSRIASAMTTYDPDKTWTPVTDE